MIVANEDAMKIIALLTAIAIAALPGAAQRHKLIEPNAATEDGKALQSIVNEQDAARKQKLMEQFNAGHPKHEAGGWVWSQLQQSYLKAGNFDQAIDAGEKLLALSPADFDAAYVNLQASEGKKDSAGILKWAVSTWEAASKEAQQPKKAGQSDDDYKQAITPAKEAATYAEYALSAAALSEPDAAKAVRLIEALEQRNPQSPYFAPTLPKYAWAARQAKLLPNAVALGERAWGRGLFNEDLLLTMADYQMQQAKNPDKVVSYSEKVVEVLQAKPKPEGVSDADWAKKKNTTLGLAYWMAGTTLAGQNKQPQADKALRAALPYIKDNEQLAGPALFYLGLANYQMGKGKSAPQLADAVSFMQQSAAIKGPYQAKAQSNLAVMRKEAGTKK